MNPLNFGKSLTLILVDAAAKGTVLLVAACLARLVLRRSSAAVRHRVWGLTMGGLVLLPALSWMLPAWRLPILPARTDLAMFRAVAIHAESERPLSMPRYDEEPPNDESAFTLPLTTADVNSAAPFDSGSPLSPPITSQRSAPPTPLGAQPQSANWVFACAAIAWGLGAGLFLAGVAIGIGRTGRLWRGSQSITDEAWGRLARELCERLGLRRPVHLREHAEPVVPLTWGLLRPIILLPYQVRRWSDSMRRAVLLHELAHVHRGDVAYQLLGRCACALYWFHPLAWFGLHQLRQEREQACDDAVIGSGERASDYAAQLLEVARRYRRAGGLSLAVEITRGGSLEQRVRALFDAARSHAPVGRRLAVSLLAATGLFVSAIAILRPVAAESQTGAAEFVAEATASPAVTDESQSPALKNAVAEKKPDDPAAAESRLSTHPVTIMGVARNENGEPIAQAKVYLLSTLYEDFRRVAETTTDAQGQYAFRDAPLPVARPERNAGGNVYGAFEVLGVADGYAFAWRPRKRFIAEPRPETDNEDPGVDPPPRFWQNDPIELDLEFPAAATIKGCILDELGRPVAGVKLDMRLCERLHDEIENGTLSSPRIYELTALNQPEDVPAAVKIRKTDAEGRFEFTGLPPECMFRFDVRHPDYARMIVWAATTTDDLPKLGGRWPILTGELQLTFQAVRDAKVRVVYSDTGEPAPNVYVGVSGAGTSASKTSDEIGEVTLRLPQGEFAVELLPATGTPYLVTKPEEKLTVEADRASDPTVFNLRRACVLDVTIVDADTGLPIPHVDLWIDARQNPDEIGTAVMYSDFHFRSWHSPVADVERPVSDKDGKLRALVEPGLRRLGAVRNKRPAGYAPDTLGQLLDCEAGQTLDVEFKLHKLNAAGKDGNNAQPPASVAPDDRADDDSDETTPPPKQPRKAERLSALNLAMQQVFSSARAEGAGAEAARAPVFLNATLRRRIAFVDRICGLAAAQREKLNLAGQLDEKRLMDRVEEIAEEIKEIKAIRTEWEPVQDDVEKVEALLKRAQRFNVRLSPFSFDESMSAKVLEQVLTAEQRARYRPFQAIFRARGTVQMSQCGAGEVKEIGLSGTKSPDDGLALVGELPSVQILRLANSGVTDAGLSHMDALTGLQRLELHNTSVTHAGIMHLKGMTKLEWLTLDNTQMTDTGLAELAGLTRLKCLSLSGTQVTDAGLVHLKGMTILQRLQLRSTRVTDAGLGQLKGLTELEFLGLAKTQVTDAGVADLKRALPNLRIER